MDYCVICLNNKNTKDNKFVLNPSLDAFEKLLARARERHNYKDSKVTEGVTATELFDQHAQYPGSCYKSITNIEKVQRAKKRCSDSIETGELSISKRKAGRLSLVAKIVNIMRVSQQDQKPFDKSAYVICQKPGGKLHEVMFDSTGETCYQFLENWRKNLFLAV